MNVDIVDFFVVLDLDVFEVFDDFCFSVVYEDVDFGVCVELFVQCREDGIGDIEF